MATRRRTSPRRLLLAAMFGVPLGVLATYGLIAFGLPLLISLRDPVSGDLAAARGDRPGIRVLFVGNSLTYRNDLPGMVRDLAAHLDEPQTVFAVSYTVPNATLRDASRSDRLARLIAGAHWDYVVLQEQSVIPSWSPEWRDAAMDGPVSILAQEIAAAGAEPLFYDTWAYANGDPTVSGDTFDEMTARVLEAYTRQARRTGGRVVPVGLAWAAAHRLGAERLWASDGNHPSRSGTYLAAATFVAALVGPAARSSFTAGLPPERALQLQRDAATAVATMPAVAEVG